MRGVCVLVAVVLWAPALLADSDETEIARGHFRTGQAYYQTGRFADAAREFEEAYRFFGRAELLYNIGKSYDGAGDFVRAHSFYRRYVEAAPESSDAEGIRQRIDELSSHIAHLTVRVKVAGATVRLDGTAVGSTPLATPVELNPGVHRIEVARDGFATWTEEVNVVSGGSYDLAARLVELAPVPLVEARKTPVYKRWWLWTAVSVVLVGGAVTGGVLGARAASQSGQVGSTLPVVH
jgi:tetratricopeptide (TPR) repeat protein